MLRFLLQPEYVLCHTFWLKGSGRSREVREKNCVWHYTESEEACQHDQYHIVTRGICRNGYGIIGKLILDFSNSVPSRRALRRVCRVLSLNLFFGFGVVLTSPPQSCPREAVSRRNVCNDGSNFLISLQTSKTKTAKWNRAERDCFTEELFGALFFFIFVGVA